MENVLNIRQPQSDQRTAQPQNFSSISTKVIRAFGAQGQKKDMCLRAFSEKVESEKCSFGDSQVPPNLIQASHWGEGGSMNGEAIFERFARTRGQ